MDKIKIVFDKTFKKSYSKLSYNSISLMNYRSYIEFCSIQNKTKEKWRKINDIMLGDNRELFKKRFGSPLFKIKYEFYYHCWVFEFKGYVFLVATAKNKGTNMESISNYSYLNISGINIEVSDKPTEQIVKEFCEEFYEYVTHL